jgi:hypothetical protein
MMMDRLEYESVMLLSSVYSPGQTPQLRSDFSSIKNDGNASAIVSPIICCRFDASHYENFHQVSAL